MTEESLSLSNSVKSEVPRARARFIAQSIQLEESDAPGVVSIGILTTAILCIAGLIWAYVTPVNEVAITQGEVVPSGNHHVVQHFEGGIVKEIYIDDGQLVEKGDVLIKIEPSASESDLEQIKTRHALLKIQQIRLESIIDNTKPNFDEYKNAYSNLVSSEQKIYFAQNRSHESQKQVASTQIKQREEELLRERNKLVYLKRELDALKLQVEMREELANQGFVSRAEYLDRTAELAETETEYQQTLSSINVSTKAVEEAKQALIELENKFNENINLEAGKISGELAELEKNLVKLSDRVYRLDIKAPVSGIVKGLMVNTIHSVIKPGATIMEIIPVGDELIVESKVATTDIGHIYIGQEAEVKVNSYDPHRFGTVIGEVQQISASTFIDEENNPYFRATIGLDKDYLGSNPGQHRIIPGMTVQADIKTGEKSVLDYLLKPVYRGFQNAFQER